MARQNKVVKTTKQNIYKVVNINGKVEYLTTFTIKGRRYIEKNLTTKFGVTTLTNAVTKLEEIKSMLRNGEDPFIDELEEERKERNSKKDFRDMVIDELEKRKISENTRKAQLSTFKKHAYPLLDKKKIDDINLDTMEITFNELSKTVKNDVLKTIKKAMSPTLIKAVEKNQISINPLETKTIKDIKGEITSKAPLSYRLNAPLNKNVYEDTAKALYKSINNFENIGTVPTNEIKLALLFALMTGRRRSEILKLMYEDIIGDAIKVRVETTKTEVYEFYPIPKEIIKLLDKDGKGLIFPNTTTNTYSKYMRQVINDAKINSNDVSGHDTRNLFLTIMSKRTKNPFLCDMCLSHNKREYKMLLRYYEPDYEDFKSIFEEYWDVLRKTQ